LRRLLQHAEGEANGDLEAVMATLSPNPCYHTYGSRPALSPVGRDDVRRFYVETVFGAGLHFFQFDMDRIVVDDHTIVTEGDSSTLLWGRDAKQIGYPIDDEEAFYLMQLRMILAWPFDADCLILGEDSYSAVTRPDFMEKVEESRLPAKYREYVARRRASVS
jgi:SnoaL-like domain